MKLSLITLGLLAAAPAFSQKGFVSLSAGVSGILHVSVTDPSANRPLTAATKLEIGMHLKRSVDFGLQFHASNWRVSKTVYQPTIDLARPALTWLLFVRKNLVNGKNSYRFTLAAGCTLAISDPDKTQFETREYRPGQFVTKATYEQTPRCFGPTVSPQIGYRRQFTNRVSGCMDVALLVSQMDAGDVQHMRYWRYGFKYTMVTLPFTVGIQVGL